MRTTAINDEFEFRIFIGKNLHIFYVLKSFIFEK